MEDIKPGELNQPIDVPQLHVRKCNECGQPLPESYQAPSDEPWTTGIFDCAEDAESQGGLAFAAATAALHGFIDPRTTFLIGEGLFFSWWMCGIYTGLMRQSLQKKYHLKNSPCDPCMVHCCLHWCALCQEHREMKSRLSDDSVMPMTIVNPPPIQQMNAAADVSRQMELSTFMLRCKLYRKLPANIRRYNILLHILIPFKVESFLGYLRLIQRDLYATFESDPFQWDVCHIHAFSVFNTPVKVQG